MEMIVNHTEAAAIAAAQRRIALSDGLRRLVRLVLLEFAKGSWITAAEAKRRLAGRVSATTVQKDIREMEELGMFRVHREGRGNQVRHIVCPTMKLVEAYRAAAPVALTMVARSVDRWRDERVI